MKKKFEFKVDEEKYILINTNPNEQKSAFEISKKEMQFNTNEFYQYIFADITTEMEIDIVDKSEANDRAAKRLYGIISEITSGVINKINENVTSMLAD